MKVTEYTIVDHEIFERNVESISINLRSAGSYLVGDVTINDNTITGDHTESDYEQSHGFRIGKHQTNQ